VPSLGAELPAGKALRDSTPRIYDALRVLADAARAIPGRKNLLLYSAGFGDVDRLGDDQLGQYTRDTRFYPAMAKALNGANVAVYGVDLTPIGIRNELQNSLNDLALDTGGRLFFNLQSFARPLEEVARETNGYYLLAYRSQHPAGAGGYQRVDVELANPEFEITARRGYRFGG
jgi:VWFA-related protein